LFICRAADFIWLLRHSRYSSREMMSSPLSSIAENSVAKAASASLWVTLPSLLASTWTQLWPQ
jgi:hypothetical protein